MAQTRSEQTKEGQALAKEAKENAVKHLREGGTLRDICELSRGKDAKHIETIPLYYLISRSRGWDSQTAKNALVRVGFRADAKVRTIRNNDEKLMTVSTLMNASGAMFRNRPKVPSGWPWNGKLEAVLDDIKNGIVVTAEEAMNRNEEGKVVGRKRADEKKDSTDKLVDEGTVDEETGEIIDDSGSDSFDALIGGIDDDDFEEPTE